MPHRLPKPRKWVVLLVGMALWGSLPLAIALNSALPPWSLIGFEYRNVLFFLWFAFVFGVVSAARPLHVSRQEVVEGVAFSRSFLVVGLGFLYLRGWWFGIWTLIPPALFFLSQTGALSGRTLAGRCRPKLRNPGFAPASGLNAARRSSILVHDPARSRDARNRALAIAVGGMTCAACVRHVEKALLKAPGVSDARVNLANERADLVLAPGADRRRSGGAGQGTRAMTPRVAQYRTWRRRHDLRRLRRPCRKGAEKGLPACWMRGSIWQASAPLSKFSPARRIIRRWPRRCGARAIEPHPPGSSTLRPLAVARGRDRGASPQIFSRPPPRRAGGRAGDGRPHVLRLFRALLQGSSVIRR